MFVEVLYHKPEISGYAGSRYTFYTDLPLVEKQRVLVPPDNKKALVVGIVEDEESVLRQPWADRIKTITQLDLD